MLPYSQPLMKSQVESNTEGLAGVEFLQKGDWVASTGRLVARPCSKLNQFMKQ